MTQQKPHPAGLKGQATVASLSPEAFADRFRCAYRTLWYIAVAICRDRVLADDILQESAMIGLRKLDQFDPATNFLAWMGKIVRYVALNHVRNASRHPLTPIGSQIPVGQPEASSRTIVTRIDGQGRFDADELGFDDQIVQALMELDETPRICLLLRTVHDMSYRGIAHALDVPEGTAMSHVHRARQILRRKLSPTPDEAKL